MTVKRPAWREELAVVLVVVAGKLILLHAVGFRLEEFSLRWDGGHFVAIAERGYFNVHELAFGPLFPLMIRGLSMLGLKTWLSAFLLANALSFVPPLLVLRRYGLKAAVLLSLNPAYVLFTTAPYSEALALSLALLAYELMEERPGAAGALLGLAVVAKYSMVLLAPAFVLSGQRKRFLAPFITFCLLLAAFFYRLGGSPLVYLKIERAWDSSLGGPIEQARWLLGSWFVRQGWHVGGFELSGAHWLLHHWAFVVLYTVGLLLLARKKLWTDLAFSAPTVLLQYFVTGVPAVSAPRLLLPAVPAWCALAETEDYVFIALTLAMLVGIHYAGLWHMEAFFG
jgi:Gpi18-like mannosyltransferase